MAQTATPPPQALDQQDSRVKVGSGGPNDMLTNFGYRVRSGDLGPLPVVVGLIIIAVVFQALNSLFLSSAYFPRNLLTHPFDTIARYNPLSYIAEGMREPIVSSLHARPVLEGLGASLALTVVAVGLSVVTLRGRLRQA